MIGRAIPAGPQQLTPEWLTSALRETGVLTRARVASFEAKVIGEGAGFMGQLAHVRLEYDRPEEGAPRSLIAKFPAAAQENREVATFFRFYEREVGFYQQIAETVELRTPRCYHSAFDPQTGDFVLLLEDLAPARCGDQLAGCAVEQADLAIREVAKLHAAWWDSPALDKLDWMPSIHSDWYVGSVVQGYSDAWPVFAQHFAGLLSPELREVAGDFPRHIGAIMNQLGTAPTTIVHGDYRLDNLFFGTAGGDEALSVIDWQISSRGRGAFDVAYFLTGTLTPADRKAKERDLLTGYHRMLTERGVRGYDFEKCWRDYRVSCLLTLVYPVIGMGSLDLANERGVELFTTILKRTASAIADLKAYELLPS